MKRESVSHGKGLVSPELRMGFPRTANGFPKTCESGFPKPAKRITGTSKARRGKLRASQSFRECRPSDQSARLPAAANRLRRRCSTIARTPATSDTALPAEARSISDTAPEAIVVFTVVFTAPLPNVSPVEV